MIRFLALASLFIFIVKHISISLTRVDTSGDKFQIRCDLQIVKINNKWVCEQFNNVVGS